MENPNVTYLQEYATWSQYVGHRSQSHCLQPQQQRRQPQLMYWVHQLVQCLVDTQVTANTCSDYHGLQILTLSYELQYRLEFHQHCNTSIRASITFLERPYPHTWGRRQSRRRRCYGESLLILMKRTHGVLLYQHLQGTKTLKSPLSTYN